MGIGRDALFLLVCSGYGIRGVISIGFTVQATAGPLFYLFFQFFSKNLQLFDLLKRFTGLWIDRFLSSALFGSFVVSVFISFAQRGSVFGDLRKVKSVFFESDWLFYCLNEYRIRQQADRVHWVLERLECRRFMQTRVSFRDPWQIERNWQEVA